MEISRNQRLDWVDFAKGCAIILVVYGHVQQGLYLSGMKVPQYFSYAEKIIYSFHMQLFFFLSGIFVAKSLSKGIGPFLLDKVKVILYPYFLWSLLHGALQVILSPYTNDKLTFIDLLQVVYKPIAHFWFLQALFLSCVLYALLVRYLPIYIVFLIALLMYISKFFVDIIILNNVLRMFMFFVMGSMFTLIFYKVREYFDGKILILAVGVFLVFQVTIFQVGIVDQPLVKLVAVCVGIFFVLSLSIYFQKNKTLDVIRQLGFMVMPIYLAHTIGTAGTRIVLSKVFHIQNISIHLIFGCIAGLLFPVLLYYVMQRIGFPYLFTANKGSTLAKSLSNSDIAYKKA